MYWRQGPRHLAILLGTKPTALVACAAALVLTSGALVWLGSRATGEWRHSVEQLVERRTDEKVALLAAALNQDMRGALNRVLVPITEAHIAADAPHDLADLFARAFARFPYPESFFTWRDGDASGGEALYVFTRADRPPAWTANAAGTGRYPVVIGRAAGALAPVLAQLRAHATHRWRFAVLHTTIGGTPHQVVAQLMYRGPGPRLSAVAGFTVSLPWVRDHYFAELARQVSSIGGSRDDASLAILDERGIIVAETSPYRGRFVKTRTFPMLFFDPALLPRPPGRPEFPSWTARVSASDEGALAAAGLGSQRLFALISLAAAATLGALLLTTVAIRAHAQLAAMKSEFVSAATHELKTPLSAIRLIADTLGQGRYDSPATVADYARLLSTESSRLGHLIDNLLAYARVSDVERFYTFSDLDVGDLVNDALDGSSERLAGKGFDVQVDVDGDLPPVHADRNAMLQVLGNLIDNAVKYSGPSRTIAVKAQRREEFVHVSVADRGPGIPADEQARVFEKFYRGRTVRAGGSGLGLTIAARIVRAHGGTIVMQSAAGEGTVVDVALPIARRPS